MAERRRVYVGNLPFDAKLYDLEEFMGEVGKVTDCHIKMGDDGKSRGFAICTYEREDDAERAVRKLKDTQFEGRRLLVREDRSGDNDRGGGNDRGSNNRGGRNDRRSGGRDGFRGRGRRDSPPRGRDRRDDRDRDRDRRDRDRSRSKDRRRRRDGS
eukprot:TRINITY_DN2313_c1_g1_i1.p2 TRINITY_DN2313_c1_g1~~TRINITY_DN2313_c1_g1_i1.p2  ORF type:complete len:156 (+),score=36.97 TRINITY_DN2313_c1_g1_i1:63-530(+)